MNDYITLRELKSMLPTTECYQRIPTAKHIRSSGNPVAVYQTGDYKIAVYPCGLAIGKSGRRKTAVRVDKCGAYQYDVDNKENTAFWDGGDGAQHIFSEEFFLDQPWPLRLQMAVDDQLQKNEDDREQGLIRKHPEISDDKDWMNGGHYSFEDALIHRMEKEEMLELLTEKQRRVFVLYWRGYTQQEIGEFLNISRESVKDRLFGAIKKLRKYYNTKL